MRSMQDRKHRTLYLIDGHAHFFRAYHAIRSALTSPVTKEPTNMTFGFTGMLLRLLKDYRPDYLAVVIDVSGDRETFRSELYPEYKANRPETPDDFRPQVERCLDILGQMSIPVIGVAGVEADDVIATAVRRLRGEHEDLDIRIVSRDKDLTQLLSDGVEMLDLYKDRIVSAADVFKVEGVEPEHVVDILALMGDSVDNIPGVMGIGPKTAAQLVLKYGSVAGVLAHLDEIKGKRRENLEAAVDQLPLSRRLVELKDDVEFEFELQSAVSDPAKLPLETLLDTFRKLGLNRQQKELKALVADSATTSVSAGTSSSEAPPTLFDEAFPTAPCRSGDYELITSAAALDTFIGRIAETGQVALAVQTDGSDAMSSNLCGVGLAFEQCKAAYVPIRSSDGSAHLDESAVLARVGPLLEDPSITKIGHNLKFVMNVLRRHDIQLRGPLMDTMTASYVIDATRSSHDLEVLALALLGHTSIAWSDVVGTGKAKLTFDQVPLDLAVDFVAERADLMLQVREKLEVELDTQELRGLFQDVEMPLVAVLAELEFNGIHVDPDELDRQCEHLKQRIEDLKSRIGEVSPHPFNPDSPKQLAAVLFNKPDDDPPGLGLRPLKRGKTGPSTDVEVLEKLAADEDVDTPVPGLIVEHRRLTKLVNTYLVTLKDFINPETGRVHASFHQTGAATGRLSSSDPNLQNIPIRTEVGREVRRAFTAEPGNVLVTADYSQIELRLLAHLSDDPALIEAFLQGADIHEAVAAEVFGIDPRQVTPEQRNTAKMVNFGIVYGITPYGLARRLGPDVSVDDAAAIIESYKRRFSRIEAFLEECVEQAVTNGYVETILGRRRLIPQVTAQHPQQRALGERMAINTVVQGSAADLIKLAMIDLYRRLPLRCPNVRMLLQIHDELVFEVPEAEAESVQPFLVERMQAALDLRVPLVVDSASSACWIDAK
jgi:DNA polymerase-1